MAKKSSSKTQNGGEEKPSVEKLKKPSAEKKKPKDEIDEIFSAKKMEKAEKAEKKNKKKDLSAKPKKMKKQKRRDSEDDGFSLSEPSSKSRKKTGDGLAIYTEDELGINKADGGGTPLCPFDCSCCF